ncbi:MAG: arylamine N-acetyltransferase family protein [Pseudomonadota bacterium]
MDLARYLRRIGFGGEARPDLATLRAVHRAHLAAVPYENLDVQLGRPSTTDPAQAYAKIVDRGRGGWCYEMNGLLGWALGEIGFSVTRMAGAVHRATLGEATVGNHLVLKVEVDGEAWIADVGFGDGPSGPYPLAAGAFRDHGFDFTLEARDNGWWRLHNHPRGGAPSFDFRDEAADEAVFVERCAWLQTAPDSPFVLNAVVQRLTPDGLAVLRGRTLRRLTPDGDETRLLASADELVAVLRSVFSLDLPEAAALWPSIRARHAALFGED